jgi:hypothetical protein
MPAPNPIASGGSMKNSVALAEIDEDAVTMPLLTCFRGLVTSPNGGLAVAEFELKNGFVVRLPLTSQVAVDFLSALSVQQNEVIPSIRPRGSRSVPQAR